MKEYWEFLQDDKGQFSSQRLAFFIAVFVASIMSFAGIYLEFTREGGVSAMYVLFTLAIWLIATLQKNWAKQIEKLKNFGSA